MSLTTSERGAAVLWIALLIGASLVSTWALACMMPFAALAALAATHMRARDGATLMLGAWAVNQAIGFGVLHYPRDPMTIAWGVALGLAALGAVGGGYLAQARAGRAPALARVALAFVAAFIAFKLVLLAADAVLGGYVQSTVGASVLVAQVPREAAVTLALLLLYRGLTAAGVPSLARQPVLA